MRRAAAILATAAVATATAAAAATAPPAAAAAPGPRFPAPLRAAALIESHTAQPLYQFRASREVAIASTTKLMTALLTLEHARLRQTFTEPDYHPAAADSQIGLEPGERMSVHDLLLALLLPSADDAAEDLAFNVGRHSVARFIAMMNARARQLRLRHTQYSTPIGLDTPGNHSSARDLLTLARHLLRTERFFRRAVRLPRAVLRTGRYRRVVVNRNDLVGRIPWINGVKTGHTLDAGYVLVGSGTRNGVTMIGVVLGASSEAARDADTLALLDYGFANFQTRTPVTAGAVLARPTVRYRAGQHAIVVAARTYTHVFRRSVHVSTRVEVPNQLAGPLPRQAVVGKVVVLVDGRAVASVPLQLAHALAAVSPLTVAAAFVTRPVTLLAVLVLLAAGLWITMLRRGRVRARRAAAR